MNREEPSGGRRLVAACLLAVLTFGLYARTRSFEFLSYGDPDVLTGNPVEAHGLSAAGLRWAFGFHASSWQPLTWLSHMLDVELFGLAPGPMHGVSAGLHALNAGLLFLALAALTLRFWPSLLVAVLFAVHPLRVQCVAWIAERKELLAGACFFGLLIAHSRYARKRSTWAYASVVALLILGCMASPMLVTAPFVLLLLDAWPLGRWSASPQPDHPPRSRVLLEKAPLIFIVTAACVATVAARRSAGAPDDPTSLSVAERIWSAGAGVLASLRASVWPSGLAVSYPNPLLDGGSVLAPGLSGAALILLISLGAWLLRRRRPALFTGWFWFLGMLVPALGLMPIGDQLWADRTTYLPTIGLGVALVFGLAEALREREAVRTGLTLSGLAAAGALAVVTARTLPHWQDSRALFEHALEVTDGNWMAHDHLGLVYLERHETDRARAHFEEALRIRPSFVQGRYDLGLAQEADRKVPLAIESYRAVLQVRPGHPWSLVRMAELAHAEGDDEQAKELFDQAIQANPSRAPLRLAYARLLLETGDLDGAAIHASGALELDAYQADAHTILADVALRRGQVAEAREHLARAEALAPPSAEMLTLRGGMRFMQNDLTAARSDLEQAILLDPNAARARYNLGSLLLRLGEVEAARSQFQAVDDIRSGDPEAAIALAAIASKENRHEEAIRILEGVLARSPGQPLVLTNLAAIYEQTGAWREALECYEKSFDPGPPEASAARNAAWILATGPDESLLDGRRAVRLAEYALQHQADNVQVVLAAAYARQGRFEQAVRAQEQAVQGARNAEERRTFEELLQLYRAGKAYTRPR